MKFLSNSLAVLFQSSTSATPLNVCVSSRLSPSPAPCFSYSMWSPCVISTTPYKSMTLKPLCSLCLSATSKTTHPAVYPVFPPYCLTGTSNPTCSNLKPSSLYLPIPVCWSSGILHQIRNLGFFLDSPLFPYPTSKQCSVLYFDLPGICWICSTSSIPTATVKFLPFSRLGYLKPHVFQNDPLSDLSPKPLPGLSSFKSDVSPVWIP